MRMIDEVEERMDLFDQILNGTSFCQGPTFGEDLTPPLVDEPIMALSSDSQDSPKQSPNKKTFCTCTKSQCRQKYCPCFKEGSKCGVECSCTGCTN